MFLFSLLINTQLNKEPKFCVNCRHFLPDKFVPKYSLCSKFIKSEKTMEYLITGKQYFIYEYCLAVRNDEKKCGYLGKQHELMPEAPAPEVPEAKELEPDDPNLWGEQF